MIHSRQSEILGGLMKNLTMKQLYEKKDQLLRMKDTASRLAFEYDKEIERRKERRKEKLMELLV